MPPKPPQSSAQMRAEIDTLRAIVCLVLVLHHMVGISPEYGMELPLDHPISLLSHSAADMRMPVFSFISGMVFARATGLWPDARTTIRKKARRLLLPMVSVGTLFWIAREATGGEQPPLLLTYVTSYAHFWFLQATFLIMAATVILVCCTGANWHRHVAAALGILGLCWWGLGLLPLPATNWLSISNAAFLLPFFASGYLLSQTPALRHTLRSAPWTRPLGALLLATGLYIGFRLANQDLVIQDMPRRLLAILLGFSACFGLLMLRPNQSRLARIGVYSYAIYLFHVFFTAAVTQLWWHLEAPGSIWALTALGVILGTMGPILLQSLILKSPVCAQLCLGLSAATLRTARRKEKERALSSTRSSHS